MRHERNRQTGLVNAYKQDIVDRGQRIEIKGKIYYEKYVLSKDKKRTVCQRVGVGRRHYVGAGGH